MKNDNKLISAMSLMFISILMMVGCKPDTEPSLTDLSGDKGEPAIITSALSSSGVTAGTATGYSGVTEVTIKGGKFLTNAEDNSVYFGSAKAEVLSATATELVVKAPIIYGDSLNLKISKPRVEEYSNAVLFKLTSAVNEYYPFLANQVPYSVTSDLAGNIYFSLVESSKGIGTWMITADSSKLVNYAPRSGETFFNDLKYHADGYLIGVYGNKAMFKIESGTKPKVFVNTKNNDIKLTTLDFDEKHTIWASGKGGKIVSVKPNKSFKLFDYADDIVAVRVFNNNLYAISGNIGKQNVVRFPIISADSLGSVETVFAFSKSVGDPTIIANSLTFSQTGNMYIATNASDGIMVVYPNGAFGSWYKNLILPEIISLTWTTGTEAFVTRKSVDGISTQTILKIDMERLGAPELGRN